MKIRYVLAGLIAATSIYVQAEENIGLGAPDQATLEKTYTTPPYSPYAGHNFPTRPFFGDTHLHTAASLGTIFQRGRSLATRIYIPQPLSMPARLEPDRVHATPTGLHAAKKSCRLAANR